MGTKNCQTRCEGDAHTFIFQSRKEANLEVQIKIQPGWGITEALVRLYSPCCSRSHLCTDGLAGTVADCRFQKDSECVEDC